MQDRLALLPSAVLCDRPASVAEERSWSGDTFVARLVNQGPEAIRVAEWRLFDGDVAVPDGTPIYGEGFQMLAQTEGTWEAPVAVGRCPDAGKYRIVQDDGFHTVFNVLTFRVGETWHLLGFARCERFSGAFRVGRNGRITVVMETEGVRLPPGETWESEPLVVLQGESRHGVLTTFAQRVGACHPRLSSRERPTGWCSWYHYYERVTEADILENLQERNRRFPGLRYVQVDDGYQAHMGDWLTTSDRFGGGVQSLVQRIREQGCEPALWVAPFIAEGESEVFRRHPDWFVQGDDGEPLPAERVTYGGWRCTPWFMLDGTHPEVHKHLRNTFQTMRGAWGVQYFKLDACYWGAVRGRFHDASATRVQAYRRGMRAILDGAGEDAFVLGCNAPLWPSLGLVHGMRVSDDIRRDGVSLRRIARESLFRSWQNDALWVLDPDCVCLSGLSGEDEAFHLAAHAACGGMVLSGDRLAELDERQTTELRRLVSLARRSGEGGLELADDLSRAERVVDGDRLVWLFNWGREPRQFRVGTRDVLVAAGGARVVDVNA